MPSIGNDIVDLSLIDVARSKQARFYSKILAPEELHLHESFGAILPFEHFVWLCWTIKEATYKFSKRLHPQLLFSPPRTVILSLSIDDNTDGEHIYQGTCSNGPCSVYFQSSHTSAYIHTIVAETPSFKQISTAIFTVDTDDASSQTRARLLQYAAQLYPANSISINKNEHHVPTLMIDPNAYPVSISHHGRFGGFAVADINK